MLFEKSPEFSGESRPKDKVLLLIQGENQDFSDILFSLKDSFDYIVEGYGRSESEYAACQYSLVIPLHRTNVLEFITAARLRHTGKPCFVYLPQDMRVKIDNILSAGMRDITVILCERGETGLHLSKLIASRKQAECKRDLLLKFSKQFLVGTSHPFQTVLQNVLKVSDVQSPVLITGETGTGKELFARAIHYLSQRSGKPFIPLNCGGLHEQLFENELFGHVKGAYTGAIDSRQGVINEATGGTLFLDEINTLSTLSQAKLLRFLEDKTYRKLGSANIQEVDIRILSATNISDLPPKK